MNCDRDPIAHVSANRHAIRWLSRSRHLHALRLGGCPVDAELVPVCGSNRCAGGGDRVRITQLRETPPRQAQPSSARPPKPPGRQPGLIADLEVGETEEAAANLRAG